MNLFKTIYFTALLLLLSVTVQAQYFYSDIIANHQSVLQYQALKKAGIKKVTATSFENDNQPAENFALEQSVSKNAERITTSASTANTHTLSVNSFANNKIVKTEDSTANVLTVTDYAYDANGRLTSLIITTIDTFITSRSEEKHLWFYNEKGTPAYMLKIKDNTDTTKVEFVYDETGNIAEEQWYRKGRQTENYFYYYDKKNRLTDIVRYNAKVKKMLPDFLFEYDELDRIVKQTQLPVNTANYMVWVYSYNEDGLKASELLLNKQKQVVGRIVYNYQKW